MRHKIGTLDQERKHRRQNLHHSPVRTHVRENSNTEAQNDWQRLQTSPESYSIVTSENSVAWARHMQPDLTEDSL